MNYGGITNLVDIRNKLRANRNGGPNQRVSLASKTGIVVHYNGPPVQQSGLSQLTSDAAYHCQEIWGYDGGGNPLYGDGIMYHIGIGEDGTAYLMRDFEQVLWHCATWPQNATALSVTLPIGDGQHATKPALATLKRICDEWRTAGHGKTVWGHQELSPTSCPGTLQREFVIPYREGKFIVESAKGNQTMVTTQKFNETGFVVSGGFLQYFLANGSIKIFGLPISNELQEITPDSDGKPITIQYFERARFEWHPHQVPQNWDVMLGRLGSEAYNTKVVPKP